MDQVMEWPPMVAIVGGLFVGVIGAVVALPAVVFPPFEAIALAMVFGGFGAAIWGGDTIYSQNQLEKAQARYEDADSLYSEQWDGYKEALEKAEQDLVELGQNRVRAVYTLLDFTGNGSLTAHKLSPSKRPTRRSTRRSPLIESLSARRATDKSKSPPMSDRQDDWRESRAERQWR